MSIVRDSANARFMAPASATVSTPPDQAARFRRRSRGEIAPKREGGIILAWRRVIHLSGGTYRPRLFPRSSRGVAGGQRAIGVVANCSGRISLTAMITSAGTSRRRAATRIASAFGASYKQ
jgi:hypothetical protein